MVLKKPRNPYAGSDFYGKVIKVGSKVTTYKVDDLVFGDLSSSKFGAYSSYIDCYEKDVMLAPNNLNASEIAALQMPTSTALTAIKKAKLKTNNQILIYGASGGVGLALTQILTSKGYHVDVVASQKHHEVLKQLGVNNIFDYNDSFFKLPNNRYNTIFAVNGYQKLKTYRKSLKKKGRYIGIGGDMRQTSEASMKGFYYNLFTSKKVKTVFSKTTKELLKEIKELAETNVLKPKIGKVYKLDDVKTAYEEFSKNTYSGKIILESTDDNNFYEKCFIVS